MNELILLVCLFTFFVIIYIIFQRNNDLIYVKSTVTGEKYLVQNFEDKQQAANLMAKLVTNLDQCKNILFKKFPNNPNVIRLSKRFNKDNIMENSGNYNYTSYSVNKGEKIIFCIRTRDKNNNLIDINTITFVALHEMAHLMSKSIGHTEEFWNNFKFILKEAETFGIYKNVDYSKNPKKYCGMKITDNPYFG